MEKERTLELKDIACYFPYDLKVQNKEYKIGKVIGIDSTNIVKVEYRQFTFSETIFDIKPILHPMSDLYQEINGVIPILELAEIAFPKKKFLLSRTGCWCGAEKFMFDKAVKAFRTLHESGGALYKGDEIINQLDLFNYLFSHHFDVYNLIGQGLAIDINQM